MKKVDSTWLYILGTLVIFGIIVLLSKDILIPRLFNRLPTDPLYSIESPSDNYIDPGLDYLANIVTSEGSFTVDLFEKNAPKNVSNFIYLSKNDYYHNTYFHRLIPGLLIQGGDRNTLNQDSSDDGFGKTPYYIEDEVNWDSLNLPEERKDELSEQGYNQESEISSIPLQKYSLVMANSGPDTNSSQFFIVLADDNDTRLAQMNGQFTVIGEVILGNNVIDNLNNIPVDNINSNTPTPQTKIYITSIEIINK